MQIPPLAVPSTLYSSLHSAEVVKAFKEGQKEQKEQYNTLKKKYDDVAGGAQVRDRPPSFCASSARSVLPATVQFEFVVGDPSPAPADDILAGTSQAPQPTRACSTC